MNYGGGTKQPRPPYYVIVNAGRKYLPLDAPAGEMFPRASDERLRHNKAPHEQVLAELGITQDEIDNYRDPVSRIRWTEQAKADLRMIEVEMLFLGLTLDYGV